MNPPFSLLRTNRRGPGGQAVAECHLLDETNLPGVRAVLSSWLVDLSSDQADRLERFFREAGIPVKVVNERSETTAAAQAPTATRRASTAVDPANLFANADG